MKQGYLSNYFEGIAVKRLSAVEANPKVSNQHEFNGVNRLKKILGTERCHFPTKFVYFGENEDETTVDTGFVTWYDSRENHPTRSEYRLYYPATTVSEIATEGDLLVIGKLHDGSVLVLITRAETTFENNVFWLFNLPRQEILGTFAVQEIEKENDPELDFASRIILAELGIEITETDESFLELMLDKFNGQFPTTHIFSIFARETLDGISAIDDPDKAVIAWMDREELLFRTLERHLVDKQLKNGFENVDAFLKYSKSIHQRRYSRAGYALENHLEQIFKDNQIIYSRGKVTEKKSKPDFIFPDIQYYHNEQFPNTHLTMLGAKSTCKDRWRQVLTEAVRIQNKHLLTLEPGISEYQTNQMITNKLQLVLPQSLHKTFTPQQQSWLINLETFLNLVKTRQNNITSSKLINTIP